MDYASQGSSISYFDYSFLEVKDVEKREEEVLAKMNVWYLSDYESFEREELEEYLVHAVKDISMTALLVVLDFSRPWSVKDQLDKWKNVIFKFMEKGFQKHLTPAQQESLRKRIEHQWKKYEMPAEEGETPKQEMEEAKKEGSDEGGLSEEEQDVDLIPLEEGVLNVNVGMPLIIACNKADYVPKWQEGDYKFDYVMRHVREFALMFGASVFTVSAVKNRGLDTVYKYILH